MHKVNDEVAILKAKVGPSQSVNKPNHRACVLAEVCGRVLRGGCTCTAGEASVCSHIATKRNVQLCKIDGMTGHLQLAPVDPKVQRQTASTN